MPNENVHPPVDNEQTESIQDHQAEEGIALEQEDYQANPGSQQFLLQQLASLQADLDEQKNAALRAMAEMENIRRRAQEDIQKASKFAIESFAEQLLSAKDSLEMALLNPSANLENLRQGVELTLKQLSQAFERAKIVEVAAAGQVFDPSIHQAVSTIASDQPANTVVQVYQKGYRLNDRVLRPALVVVAQS